MWWRTIGLLALLSKPLSGQVVSAPALPASVGAFRLTETRIFADSLLGTWYRYSVGREPWVDVMVQRPLTAEHRVPSVAETIERAVASFKSLRMVQAGTTSFQFAVDQADTVRIGPRSIPGHVVQARLDVSSDRTIVLHVYHLGERYVRIMGTVPGSAAERDIASFAQQLLPALITAWRL